MAQRKITPKPMVPKPMHVDASVHVTNGPPTIHHHHHTPRPRAVLALELLTAASFLPAAFEPRALVATAVLSAVTAIRKAR